MKVLEFLDGKKTVIGAIASPVVGWLIIKGYIDGDTATLVLSIVSIWTGIALGDKVRKAKKGK